MKLYLSSYKFGDAPEKLTAQFGTNKHIALIQNSLDFSQDFERLKQSENEQIESLKALGLDPEVLDLRKYFGQKNELEVKLKEFGGVWVRGGNTFVLRIAYKLSGFDELIKEKLLKQKDFVYAGFSAGVCILQHSLKGLELVDDPDFTKSTYNQETIWEGIGILDYAFVPHYKSDHPESADVDKVVEFYKENNIPYKTLHDGEVIIM